MPDRDATDDDEKLALPESSQPDDREQRFASGSVEFVGTATVLIRYAGLTILTDPNFLHRGDHVHLGYGMTAPRLTEPAFDIAQLPPVDLVVLSHLHGDHFDQIVEQRLDHRLPIVTTPEAARALRRKRFTAARGLRTWQSLLVSKGETRLTITSVPAQHAPGLLQLALPSVMGTVLDWRVAGGTEPAMRLYITGDTLLRDQLKEIPRRFPEIDLALLHLGGTRLFGVLLTMDGRQGVEAIRWIQPKKAIPIHFDDYPVFKSPLGDFMREVEAAGLTDRVVYLERGQRHTFSVARERWAVSAAGPSSPAAGAGPPATPPAASRPPRSTESPRRT
jgi:L-ascorbate metabolism protein UlaG (beta-lactamase superfamily)